MDIEPAMRRKIGISVGVVVGFIIVFIAIGAVSGRELGLLLERAP
jgi:tetrahydromethanopterin S-methyltransferase subunit G